MNFHSSYSELLKKLPLFIKKNIWNRLISRLRNPLTEEQASSINPNIETLLISEINKYEKKKNRQRISKTSIDNSSIQNSEIKPIETIPEDNIQDIDMCLGTSSAIDIENKINT